MKMFVADNLLANKTPQLCAKDVGGLLVVAWMHTLYCWEHKRKIIVTNCHVDRFSFCKWWNRVQQNDPASVSFQYFDVFLYARNYQIIPWSNYSMWKLSCSIVASILVNKPAYPSAADYRQVTQWGIKWMPSEKTHYVNHGCLDTPKYFGEWNIRLIKT